LPLSAAELAPTEQQSKVARTVARQLAVLHYARPPLDDSLSQVIWNRYLSDLDGQRLFFLASDIEGFSRWQLQMDDQLKTGTLTPGFTIYNRFQNRLRERLQFVLNELEINKKLFDFSGNETLVIDRKTAAWAKSTAELDQLWRLRIKSAALSLKLAGKSNEETLISLKRRYKSQLSAANQTKSEDAFQTFMNAFTETYDPHTEYFSPRSSENFNINMSLQLEGIGAVLQTDDEYTKVVRLVPGGPADKSRQLKPNDRLIAVAEGEKEFVDVVGWRIDEVVQLIRGAKGTTVRLQVLPAGTTDTANTKEVSLVRNTVALEDQAATKKIIDIKRDGVVRRVGVIKLPTFYADFQGMQAGDPNYRSTTRDVHRLLTELKQERIQGIILDLRNNGGGSLSEVNDLIGEFISTGPTVQVRDARGKVEVLGDGNPDVAYSGPLVVMTNRLSASASEIFAGAIQDYGRGIVVGGTTFGKGTVQSLRELGSGQLKITEAKFYRISGASTQNKGVVPDIVFPELSIASEIGESVLPRALPWDTIPPARYQRQGQGNWRIANLRSASIQRQARNPDFRYLLDEQKLISELNDIKTQSLNEKARRLEKQQLDSRRLAIENRRRTAKGLSAFKSWADFETQQEKLNPNADPHFERSEEAALTVEAAEILLDSLPPVRNMPTLPSLKTAGSKNSAAQKQPASVSER
jgi:carboxyl-terminal processing protease